MNQYQDFCLFVIQQRFGELGYTVSKALSLHREQTIPQLSEKTQLPLESICQSLTALLQHDIVTCSIPVKRQKPVITRVKIAKTSKSNKRSYDEDEDDLDSDFDGDVINTVPDCNSASTSLFGNSGAGFVEYTTSLKARRGGIYHAIFSNQVISSDSNTNVKMYHYTINFDMVRGLIRHPEYLVLVENLYDPIAKYVLEEFCIRGKLTLSQAVTACVSRIEQMDETTAQELLENEERSTDFSSEDISKMDLSQLSSLPSSVLQMFKNSDDSSVSERIDEIEINKSVVILQKVRRAFEWLLQHHFLTQSRGFVDKGCDSHIKKLHKKKKVQEEDDASVTQSPNSYAYVVNHDRFVLFLRNDLCVKYVTKRVSPLAGLVVAAVLHHIVFDAPQRLYFNTEALHQLTSQYAQTMKNTIPADISIPSADVLPSTYDQTLIFACQGNILLSDVKNVLEQMCYPYIDICGRRVFQDGCDFYFNIDRLCQNTRLEYTQSFVLSHCGPNAARIFRLLIDKSRLEEKQISDLCLIPRKETRECLYSLKTSNILELQDIPRTADRQPSKSFFVWSVAHQRLRETLMSYYYRIYRNTLVRTMEETNNNQSVLDKDHARSYLSDQEQERVDNWSALFMKTQGVLRIYTKILALFHDCCQ